MYTKEQLKEILYNNKQRDVLVETMKKLDSRHGQEMTNREWCSAICSCNDPFVQITMFQSKQHLFESEDFKFLYQHCNNPTVHHNCMKELKGFVAERVTLQEIKNN